MGLARRRAEEHRWNSIRSVSRTLAGCKAGGSRLRSCSERGPSRGQARWCGAVPRSAPPVATQGAARRRFQPGHGDSVETPSTRGRGDEGPVGIGGGGAKHLGVVRVQRSGADSIDSRGRASGAAELRLRGVRAQPSGAPEANADAHGVAPLRGERLGVLGASVDGRRAFGSRGRRRERRAGPGRETRCGCRARCRGGHGSARAERSPSHGPSGPSVRGTWSGCPGAVGPSQRASVQRAWSAATGHSEVGVASRGSGGNTANASQAFANPFSTGSRGLNGRGLRLMSHRSPASSTSRGFAPGAETTTV